MGQTHTSFIYHAVFSTKGRFPMIRETFRNRLHDYMGGVLRGIDVTPIRINGTADHVHLLFLAPPKLAFADIMRDLKANSSGWLNKKRLLGARFAWQNGYGAFTVSASRMEAVRRYIENQETHHRTREFSNEYRWLLEMHGIDPNEVSDDEPVIGSDSVQESVAPYGGYDDL